MMIISPSVSRYHEKGLRTYWPPVSASSGWSNTQVKTAGPVSIAQTNSSSVHSRNFHEIKNSKNDNIASPLMMGDSTLYASAMVASSDIRGKISPKSACARVSTEKGYTDKGGGGRTLGIMNVTSYACLGVRPRNHFLTKYIRSVPTCRRALPAPLSPWVTATLSVSEFQSLRLVTYMSM